MPTRLVYDWVLRKESTAGQGSRFAYFGIIVLQIWQGATANEFTEYMP
jgi:hypothetical protein